jgi:hypothetical protein
MFAHLHEEDFDTLFRDSSIKLGHRREIVHWWKSLSNSKDIRRKMADVQYQASKNRKEVVMSRSYASYPSPNATHANWGDAKFSHCVQPFSWSELIEGYKNSSKVFKMGGLGKLLEEDGYETWQCFRDHYCGSDPDDPWFCFVYHETNKVFTPWGENSQLNLVRKVWDYQGCPPCLGCRMSQDCFAFADYVTGSVVETDAVIGFHDFTFSAWVKLSETEVGIIFSRDRSSVGESQFRIHTMRDNRVGIIVDGFGIASSAGTSVDNNGFGSRCVTKTPLPVDREVHFAVVRAGASWSMFVNGELETGAECVNSAGISNVYEDPIRPVRVGSYSPPFSGGPPAMIPFKGTIRMAALQLRSVMTPDQIKSLSLSNVSMCNFVAPSEN